MLAISASHVCVKKKHFTGHIDCWTFLHDFYLQHISFGIMNPIQGKIRVQGQAFAGIKVRKKTNNTKNKIRKKNLKLYGGEGSSECGVGRFLNSGSAQRVAAASLLFLLRNIEVLIELSWSKLIHLLLSESWRAAQSFKNWSQPGKNVCVLQRAGKKKE